MTLPRRKWSGWHNNISVPSIGRGPDVKKTVVPTPVLMADRYVSYEANIRFPMLRLTYPTVPRHHPDEVALDALAAVLGGGKTSRLYQRMVKTQKAVQVNVIHPTSEFTVLSFIGLPSVRSFGTHSAGYTTGNAGYSLPNGAMLFIAGSIGEDRSGKKYPRGIAPDEEIGADATNTTDPVLEAAKTWMAKR